MILCNTLPKSEPEGQKACKEERKKNLTFLSLLPVPIMEYLILVNAIFENCTHAGNDISNEEVFETDIAEWRDENV